MCNGTPFAVEKVIYERNMWKNILKASKITEPTQFIVSNAKTVEQIYFRLAVLFSIICSNRVLKKIRTSHSHTKVIKYFFIPGLSRTAVIAPQRCYGVAKLLRGC